MNNSISKDLISVVVPVYNIEKYIEKCVNSILDQTYTNIEIILVDDGSTDSSGKLCDSFQTDDRVKVIHKKNGGLSDARNVGIKHAKGSYISFIDGDDFVDHLYLNDLYYNLVEFGADISVCEFSFIDANSHLINHPVNNGKHYIYNRKESIKVLLQQKPFSNSACGKLFKTEVFMDIEFPFGRIYEDTATIYKTFLKAHKISFIAKTLYYYVYRNQSLSKSSFSLRQMDGLIFAEKMVTDVVREFPEYEKLGLCRIIDPCVSLLKAIPPKEYPEEYNKVWGRIKQIRGMILTSKCASVKRRLIALLSYMGDILFLKVLALLKL